LRSGEGSPDQPPICTSHQVQNAHRKILHWDKGVARRPFTKDPAFDRLLRALEKRAPFFEYFYFAGDHL
jgi:hypothetical protein